MIFDRKCVEERLLGSEERFRSAFKQAPHGMCLAALDGRLLQVNRTFCEMLGRSEQELLNVNWSELTHPDDLAVSRAAMVRMISGEVSCLEFEKRYIGNLGNVIWVRVKISLLRDHGGKPSHFITHVEDETGRRSAELALRQREERFRTAFEYAPFGLALAARDGRILQVNATTCRMLGYSEEELLAIKWNDAQSAGRSRGLAWKRWRDWSETALNGWNTRSDTGTSRAGSYGSESGSPS